MEKNRPEQPTRIGIIGAGYGGVHARALKQDPRVRLDVIWSRSSKHARDFAREHDVLNATTQLDEFFTHDLDAVVIASPVFMTYELVSRAIEQGWHVLAEKPLGLDSEAALALTKAAESRGLVNMVNFDWRSLPLADELHNQVVQGRIGPVKRASFGWNSWSPWGQNGSEWKESRRLAAFGAMRGFHHVFDEIHWHLGPVRRLVSDLQMLLSDQQDELEDSIADDAVGILGTTLAGVRFSVCLNRLNPGSWDRYTELIGEDGALRLIFDDYRDRVPVLTYTQNGMAPTMVATSLTGSPIQAQFLSAIRGGTSEGPTFRSGAAALLLAEAAARSSRRGAWEELPPSYGQLFLNEPP